MLERPRVPLDAQLEAAPSPAGLELQRFSFAAARDVRVPGILLKPASRNGKLAAVIALHGTGGNKEGQFPLLERLARRGFLAIAVDGRYHGARSMSGKGSGDYVAAMLRVYRGAREYPFLYDTVWDIMRLIDWIGTRPDADSARIGMIGFSKGGMETYLTAAVDERVAAAVPCIGVQSFRWAIQNDAWQSRVGTFQAALDAAARDGGVPVDAAIVRRFYDRVAPGVYGEFDGPAMLPLIAPRPLLAINGEADARAPLPGLMDCVNAAKAAYEKQNAADRFRFVLQPKTGHRVNPESLTIAVEWFERWLGRPVTSGSA